MSWTASQTFSIDIIRIKQQFQMKSHPHYKDMGGEMWKQINDSVYIFKNNSALFIY